MTYASLRLARQPLLRWQFDLTRPVLSCMLILFAAAPSFAQVPTGNPTAGRELVERQCNACHDGRGPQQGPSLRAVAAMPSTTSLSLHVFLLTPHANMPNYRLTTTEIDDVVAYILSLRR